MIFKVWNKTPANRLLSLDPNGSSRRGNVLLSYITAPFSFKSEGPMPIFHANYWECSQIAKTFQDFGFRVDVINYDDEQFIPKDSYKFFIDIHHNIKRLGPVLNPDCVKILHLTGSHSSFQNHAEYSRLLDLQKRRGVSLAPRRSSPHGPSIEYADYATALGNQSTLNTYKFSGKKIFPIPASAQTLYPFPEKKDFEKAKRNFLWLGSRGMVHKGLDLVLEAFLDMPEFHLTICGNVTDEEDFERAYYKELYLTSHIKTMGWVDVGGELFKSILNQCAALIYPSCSEGAAGSVITCMQAGLIPIVSSESGIDIEHFGTLLNPCTVESIKTSVQKISRLPNAELDSLSRKTWDFARAHYTRESFANAYRNFIQNILLKEAAYERAH